MNYRYQPLPTTNPPAFAREAKQRSPRSNAGSPTSKRRPEVDALLKSAGSTVLHKQGESNEELEEKKHAAEMLALLALRAEAHKHHADGKQFSLDPEHPCFNVWSVALIVVILSDVFLQPFICTYERLLTSETAIAVLRWCSFTIWLIYLLDTAVQFVTQVPNDEGTGNIYAISTLSARYVTSRRFLVDLITCIPWEWLSDASASKMRSKHERGAAAEEDMGIDLLRLLRLLSVSRLNRLARRWENTVHLSFVQRVLAECIFGFIVLVHLLACVWGMIGMDKPLGSKTWLCRYFGNTLAEHVGAFNVYIASAYWAGTTLTSIGYGDVVANSANPGEQVFGAILMVVAAAGWSVIIASAVALVHDLGQKSEDFHKTLDACKEVIRRHGMQNNLAKQSHEYFVKLCNLEEEKSTRQVIGRMSPQLQRQMVNVVYKHWIEDVPWIHGLMSGTCLVKLVLLMENFLYIPGEVIPDIRIVSFVQHGSVFLGGRMLRRGDSWGVDMTLDGHTRRRESGYAITFVSTLALRRRSLDEVLEDFPEDAWMVKRASAWMAMRRQLTLISRRVRTLLRKGCKLEHVTMSSIMDMQEKPVTLDFGNLSDDTRYLVKRKEQQTTVLAEETYARNDALAGRMGRLEDSLDQNRREAAGRLDAIEGTLAQLQTMLQAQQNQG